MSNLLVERKQEDSLMDIGQNCSKCNQLDFLPFQCEYCKLIFCSDHRRLSDHNCPHLAQLNQQNIRPKSPKQLNGQTAASLFPNREHDRAIIDLKLQAPKPVNIIEKLGTKKTAFTKITKYLHIQREKRKQKQGIKKLFTKKTNPTVDIQLLRKSAKGDGKIPMADRVYVWCLFVDANEEEDDKLFKIDLESGKRGVFLNKNWPMGRALDVISDELKIKNNNNKTNEINERLNIFKLDGEVPVLVGTSQRVKETKNGDVLYLVRGTV